MESSTALLDARDKLLNNMRMIFGDIPTVFSDSERLIEWFHDLDVPAFDFYSARELHSKQRKNAVFIPTDGAKIPPYDITNALFKNSRLLFIPLFSFDPSMGSAIYTLMLLSLSNLEGATSLNRKWLDIIMTRRDPLHLKGSGCEITCEFDDSVNIMRPKTEVALSPGEWDTVGPYFEVGLIPNPDNFRPGFTVNGVLTVPGVAVAHHRQMHPNLIPSKIRAWDMLNKLRQDGMLPLEITVENSYVTKISAGEIDLRDELEKLTNPMRKLLLTEMAFSTNSGITSNKIDWSKNSQLNEGAIGIHVGIGDGLTGAHIDLICPGVELIN